ncbi:DNA adenine methylase [Campylobacter hyointestinalis]|uniref:DNA adenine methylase n=1 Tax=Campylobacter hyointestinalis TaxID=198 RepID=UPI000DCD0DF6|nr:DNA adenine methylase [Campylobacter hyointestinalis]RAZ52105.1 DNA methyltransferase [Campylobacter hyointestinalis subsp. lawsonii]
MFNLQNRRYLGAKTKLLGKIDAILMPFLKNVKNATFFDAFAGTGVVSEYFIKKSEFSNLIINDFLYSNFAIFNGFFKFDGDFAKLEKLAKSLNLAKNISENYYSENFGEKFFSQNDARRIGFIRDKLDFWLKNGEIYESEFWTLLASLIFSVDRTANTCGHYEAFRRGVKLVDKFKFELISPLNLIGKNVEIYQNDTNFLAKKINQKIDVAFIDPPYNSRQYSRFYHLLENLTQNKKPFLSGVAMKPPLENLSEYCGIGATLSFADLIENLAKNSKIIVVTYNNTYNSKSTSSENKISLLQITQILQNVGKLSEFKFDFTPFNAGKTEFKNHAEMVFICEI